MKTGPVGKDPSYQYFYFDGSYTTLGAKGKQFPMANGDYVIVITVTKALGNPLNRSTYETWTSPTFSITQPT